MISRRELLTASPLALSACGRAQDAYFGKTDPPRTQRLVYLLDNEPRSLDPVQANERQDEVILSLFEALTGVHPSTGEPVAGLATHYQVAPDVQPKLRKPFVKGLGSNLLNREQPKYAWIDTNWRPR